MCNGSVSRGLFFFLSFLLSRWHNDWKFLHTSASGMTRENAATKQFNPRRILTCRERERDWVTGRKLAWQQQQQPTTTTRADNASLSLSLVKNKRRSTAFSRLRFQFHCGRVQTGNHHEKPHSAEALADNWGSVLSHLWEPDSYTQHSKRLKQLFSFFQSGKFFTRLSDQIFVIFL